MNTFGRCITHLREQEGISQEKLAEKLGVSRQTIYRWENGRGDPPKDKLIALAHYFQVPVTYFTEREGCAEEAVVDEKVQEDIAEQKDDGAKLKRNRFVFWLALVLGTIVVLAFLIVLLLVQTSFGAGDSSNFVYTWNMSSPFWTVMIVCGVLAVILVDVLLIVRFLRKK